MPGCLELLGDFLGLRRPVGYGVKNESSFLSGPWHYPGPLWRDDQRMSVHGRVCIDDQGRTQPVPHGAQPDPLGKIGMMR